MSEITFGGYCTDAWGAIGAAPDCCGSCHDDWDEGYDEPMDWTLNGVRYKACCRCGAAIEAAGGDLSNWATDFADPPVPVDPLKER